MPWSYVVFYFFMWLAGSTIGKKRTDGYFVRTGRASLLILILAAIIALGTMGYFVILLLRLADKV